MGDETSSQQVNHEPVHLFLAFLAGLVVAFGFVAIWNSTLGAEAGSKNLFDAVREESKMGYIVRTTSVDEFCARLVDEKGEEDPDKYCISREDVLNAYGKYEDVDGVSPSLGNEFEFVHDTRVGVDDGVLFIPTSLPAPPVETPISVTPVASATLTEEQKSDK